MPVTSMHMFPNPERPDKDGKWRGFHVGQRNVYGVAATGWPIVAIAKDHTVTVNHKGHEILRGVMEVIDLDRDLFMESKFGRLSGWRRDSYGDWVPDESVIHTLSAIADAQDAVEQAKQAHAGRWAQVPSKIQQVLTPWVLGVMAGSPQPDLYLLGAPGCGKTTTLGILASELREQCVSVYSVDGIVLSTTTRDGYSRADRRDVADGHWRQLETAQVAIVDDISAGWRATDADLWTRMQGVLDSRKKAGLPVVLADNNGPTALAEAGLEPRIVDRLKAFSPVKFTNGSYRGK